MVKGKRNPDTKKLEAGDDISNGLKNEMFSSEKLGEKGVGALIITDDGNKKILEAINATGRAFLSHTVLNGQVVMLFAIGNLATQWEDVQEVWEMIQSEAKKIGK